MRLEMYRRDEAEHFGSQGICPTDEILNAQSIFTPVADVGPLTGQPISSDRVKSDQEFVLEPEVEVLN